MDFCENYAEFRDENGEPICEDCMVEQINDGADPDSFHRFRMII